MQRSGVVGQDLAARSVHGDTPLSRSDDLRSCLDLGEHPVMIDSLDHLIIERQSRTAARKELLDQALSPDECDKLYEESLWCLYALQDDLLQEDNPFLQEDRATIATCVYFFSCLQSSRFDVRLRRDQTDEAEAHSVQNAHGHE